MEKAFITAWEAARAKAEDLGVRMRPVPPEDALKTAQRSLSGSRLSDGFNALQRCGHLELSLEALMTKGKYGALFTDEQVNWCLEVLLEAGYYG